MLLNLLLLLVGLYLILKGSEWVTDAAVPIAGYFNTTRVAIGLIFLSVLLSLPELMIALFSILKGETELGVGVSIGSIIINLGLIIGVSAMMHPLKIPRHVITRDAVFMLVATIVVTLIVLEDLYVSRRDGVVFLLLFIPYLINVFEQEKSMARQERKKESEMITKTLQFFGKISGAEVIIQNGWVIFLVGLAMLLAGSELFTGSLIAIAHRMGFPTLLVGLTLGALGPSIPNMAAAWQAVRKGYDELAVSETIGSNIFTLLVTLGLIAIAHPFELGPSVGMITAPALLIVTVGFFGFALTGRIGRFAGAVLLALYLVTLIMEFLFRG